MWCRYLEIVRVSIRVGLTLSSKIKYIPNLSSPIAQEQKFELEEFTLGFDLKMV
jgi:hypothetical protein